MKGLTKKRRERPSRSCENASIKVKLQYLSILMHVVFSHCFSKAKLPGKAIHDPFFDSLKQRPGDFDAHRTFHNQLLNEFFGLLIL